MLYITFQHKGDVNFFLVVFYALLLNNLFFSQDPMEVLLSPPPDLAVRDFNVPSQSESAATISLSWSVENVGFTRPIETYWRDKVVNIVSFPVMQRKVV